MSGWFFENSIDFFQSLTFSFWHEHDLVEETKECDTTIETNSQTGVSERNLHTVEVVGDSECPQVQQGRTDGHPLGSGTDGEGLRRNNPGQAGIGTKEPHVQDKTSKIHTLGGRQVGFNVDRVTDTNQDQPDEETNKIVTPHTTTKSVHVQHGRNGTKEQCTTTNKGHEHGVLGGETDSDHQGGQVIHDSIDTGQLTQGDHHDTVDQSTAVSWDSEQLAPHTKSALGETQLTLGFSGLDHLHKLDLAVFVVHVSQSGKHVECFTNLTFEGQVTG